MTVFRALLISVLLLIALVGCSGGSREQSANALAVARLESSATENAHQLTVLANEAATMTASTPTLTYTPSLLLRLV